MSMNFSEFKKILGSDPRCSDPEFLRARRSSPEFSEAASDADRLEDRLERAARIPVPDSLLGDLLSISRTPPEAKRTRRWVAMAMAASVLIAVGAAGLIWNVQHSWDSVEEYVVDHYRHDGELSLSGSSVDEVRELFSGLDADVAPALARIVGVIKYCPTPDGKGVHMILNTENGPVTVIYMPETPVSDREMFAFDNVEVLLVALERGSAAIIGPDEQAITGLYAFVQDSIIPSVPSS